MGHSVFPYKNGLGWTWIDLGRYIGGPVMMRLDKNVALLVGKIVKQEQFVTGLLKMNLLNGDLHKLLILASSGDNGYPGLVLIEGMIYVSYYSSHEDNKSCAYLAQINAQSLVS